MHNADTQKPAEKKIPRGIRNRAVTVSVALALAVVVLIAFECLLSLRDMARLASCRPYSVRWLAEDYADDHEGLFPPLSPIPGLLMTDPESVASFVWGMNEYICEFDRQGRAESEAPGATIDDWSYVYLGYVIENQRQLELFAAHYRETIATGGDFTQDIKVEPGEGNCGTDTIFRLRDRALLQELLPCLEGRLGEIPVVIEWPENHRGPVAKVVTLSRDSRGEVMPYPGNWPMTAKAIAVLRELDTMGPVSETPRP